MSVVQEKRREGEKERIDRIASSLSFLADIKDVIGGRWFYGLTRRGRYFEIHGYPPDNITVKIYRSRKATSPDYILKSKVDAHDTSRAMKKIARALYIVIEKELGDRVEKISLGS